MENKRLKGKKNIFIQIKSDNMRNKKLIKTMNYYNTNFI